MKVLNTHQTQIVSGGVTPAQIYYDEGYSYFFECPNVSQACLDHYISYAGKTHPGITAPITSIETVLDKCNGLKGVIEVNLCIQQAFDERIPKLLWIN